MRIGFIPAVLLTAIVAAACGSSDPGTVSVPKAAGDDICGKQDKVAVTPSGIPALPGAARSLSGAGATFPAPLYSLWASEYAKAGGAQVAYQSIGSGGGIQQISAQTVDFGASDAPMKPEEMAAAKGGPILHIPQALGAVVPTYNLKGVPPLRFDGETLGKIFAGKITKWNDPAIVAENKDAKLPDTHLVVVHRSDGSGTTSIWTDYLTKASATWVQTLGGADRSQVKEVAWPVGVGGKGNEGVSGAINQTPGSIGYVELTYAEQQGLPAGLVKNKSGSFIKPCVQTLTAATEGLLFPDDLRFSLTDAPGAKAFPISGATWLLVDENQTTPDRAKALVNYLAWTMDVGQRLAPTLGYAPLSEELRTKSVATIRRIKLNGQPLVP
jgi:phosphate transport system substrate-binding protein